MILKTIRAGIGWVWLTKSYLHRDNITFPFRIPHGTQCAENFHEWKITRYKLYLQNHINNYNQTIKSTVCVNYEYTRGCNKAVILAGTLLNSF